MTPMRISIWPRPLLLLALALTLACTGTPATAPGKLSGPLAQVAPTPTEAPAPPANVPICHIHGERDLVLPIGQAKPDRVVAGAGHVLSLSHPRQVNEYLEECMRRYGV